MAQLTSPPMIEAEETARRLSQAVSAADPRFNSTVHVMLDDGSSFLWDCAFLVDITTTDGQKWIAVIAEHYSPQVFCDDDSLVAAKMWGPRLR